MEVSKAAISKNIVIGNLNSFVNTATTYCKKLVILDCEKKQVEASIL